jgi:hypothetical protein
MTFSDIITTLNSKFEGTKTYGASIVTILGALTSYFAGTTTLLQSIYVILPAIFAMTIRHAMTTEATKTSTVAIVSAELASGREITGTL